MNETPRHRSVWSWAMYDWANSAFATTVMAGFFPVFFTDYWSRGAEPTETTLRLGIAVSTASLIVALLAPFLGALADAGGAKKRSLALFTMLGVTATGGLFFVAEGAWFVAALLYALGFIGFLASLVFYDSLLVSVSTASTVDRISARGYAMGYLGGGLLFLVNVVIANNPSLVGLAGTADAVRWGFLSVALWWGVFSIPLFLNVPEPAAGSGLGLLQSIRLASAQIVRTLREIRKVRMVLLFLVAYWFYIDGVDTIVTMALNYGMTIGFETADLITALLLVQFVAVPFAVLMGWIGQRWGTKKTILLCIGIYIVITYMGSRLDLEPVRLLGFEVKKFYLLAFMVATAQGGIQALSRSMYSRLIPKDKAAEFFGFYNMLGKFATIIGPLLMGFVGEWTGNPRAGIQSVALLFVVGGAILWKVQEHKPAQEVG